MIKQWNLKGNQRLLNNINPLRHLMEKTIPAIDLEMTAQDKANRPPEYLNLSAGDPSLFKDFKTNPKLLEIVEDGVGLVDGYTEFRGSIQARTAIASFYTSLYGTQVSPDDIYLGFGGTLPLWLSLNSLVNPGDNFLFPQAQFPIMLAMAKTIGVESRVFPLKREQNWQIDFVQLKKLVDERTRFILLNDPSNPLGVTWSRAHKQQIVAFCKENKLVIVADQIYETMTYGKPQPCFPELRGDVPVLKCSGLTKKWMVPGWRVGWLVLYGGPELDQVRKGIKNMLDVLLMPTTIVTAKLPEILSESSNDTYLKSRMQLLGINQALLKKNLSGESYCKVANSQGALYSVVEIDTSKLAFDSSVQLVIALYKQENVLTFPGEYFQSSNFIRLVICCTVEQMEEFCLRFKRFCNKHLRK